jgi:hypothetical protein
MKKYASHSPRRDLGDGSIRANHLGRRPQSPHDRAPRGRGGHPQVQAVTVAGWVTLLFGFALWPVALIWAYVDVPARAGRETQP